MEPGHEVDAPAPAHETPLRVEALGDTAPAAQPLAPQAPEPPTPASVLLAVAAANGSWFPSRYAGEAGVPRDQLDDPLAELRLTGLVRVAEWVRGVGQGYELTPEGRIVAADPTALDRLKGPAAPDRAAALLVSVPAQEEIAEPSPDPAPRSSELLLTPPLVVPVLLMANGLWFFICAVYSIRWGLSPSRALTEGHLEVLRRFGAVSGPDLLAGEWWRLISSCFVHIGALHLIGNLFALAMMGPLAELLWGRGRLLLIYFISGLAGSALAMAIRPDSLLAGASGAIWGIQMSLFAWLFAFRHHLPTDLANDWFRRLMVVFVLNAGVSFLPGVSWEGHLGGGAAGFLVAGLLNAARFGTRPRRVGAWVLLALLPVLCVAGLAGAMDAKGMRGWQRLRQKLAAVQELRDAVDRNQKARDFLTETRTQVFPRLDKLSPYRAVRTRSGVLPLNLTRVEFDAVWVLKGPTVTPAHRTAARENVQALKVTADEVVDLTSGGPTGNPGLDRTREQIRAFAAARGRSLELLLALFDAPAPDPGAWAAWRAARAEADDLWFALSSR